MAVFAVPDGHLATVVTTLEMRERPRPRPLPASPLRLSRWTAPAPDAYRTLFRRVGARWLWFSRLVMSDADLISAGMSADLELAVTAGATHLRVGTAILGRRPSRE